MRTVWQMIALIFLAFACLVIVFAVNAPKWLDGTVPTTTQSAR